MVKKELYIPAKKFVESVENFHPSSQANHDVILAMFLVATISVGLFNMVAMWCPIKESLPLWFCIPLAVMSVHGFFCIKTSVSDDEFVSSWLLATTPIIFAFNVWVIL